MRKQSAADAGDRQPVFVAMTDINANEELTAQNIKLEEWPKNIVPAGALTKLEEVEGKRCRMKLYAGEPILSSKLLGADDAIGAAKDIPTGLSRGARQGRRRYRLEQLDSAGRSRRRRGVPSTATAT